MTITETKGADGWREIALRRDGSLVAVITHPCSGAAWFVHRMNHHAKAKFKTRKEALNAAETTP